MYLAECKKIRCTYSTDYAISISKKIVQKVACKVKFGAFVKNKGRNLHKRTSSRDVCANFMKIKVKVEVILSIHRRTVFRWLRKNLTVHY